MLTPADRKDLENCFRSKSAAVFGFLYQLTGYDKVLAGDLVQETFKKATERWDELRDLPDQDREAWLIRVAKNTAISALRRKETVRKTWPEVLARYSPSEADVQALAVNRIALGHFNAAVSAMPPARRRVATLYFRYDLEQHEIAEALGISASAVNQHLKLAIRTLREKLRPYMPDRDDWEEDNL